MTEQAEEKQPMNSTKKQRFLVVRNTESASEAVTCNGEERELRQAMFPVGPDPTDNTLIWHVQKMPVGEYAAFRLGHVVRLKDEETEAVKKRNPLPLKQMTYDRLREPVARLDAEQAALLEGLLGVELIVRDAGDGMVELSRLSLANSFINDAEIGLRVAIEVETEEGPVTGARLLTFADAYTERELDRARVLHDQPPLGNLLSAQKGMAVAVRVFHRFNKDGR